jgi:DNA-binding XRE family transcriptional regulator
MRKLRRLRQAVGMTQAALAHRARIDRSCLVMAERGYQQLKPDQQDRIAKILLAAAKANALRLQKLNVQVDL